MINDYLLGMKCEYLAWYELMLVLVGVWLVLYNQCSLHTLGFVEYSH